MKKQFVDHYPSTIITTKKSIYNCIQECDHTIVKNAVFCSESISDYDFRLWHICYTLQWIGRLYYRTKKNEFKKLSKHRYYELIFEGAGETREEINQIYPVKEGVFEKLLIIFHLWSHFLANDSESTFIGEFAYAYEYVMTHDYLPEPEFKSKGSLYPENYPDYDVSTHRWFHADFLQHIDQKVENSYRTR
ncbi:MAG: hypothetical protein J6M64_04845 [Oscillospiraceae bacterium]|nr:hypothetical protein [Oscillospiraceae bacterium]